MAYNYSIYKIVCKDSSVIDIYIGSSKDIKKRISQHKSDCTNENVPNYNCKLYQTIRANGGWANYELIIIEELPNVTKTQAEIREEYWRIELSATLNARKAHRTMEQITEYDKERHKQYREKNKEQLNEQKKQWCQKNKTRITDYAKQYREKNKDELNKRRREARALKKSLACTYPPLDEKI